MPQPNHQRRYTGQQDDEHLCRFAKHLPTPVCLQNLTHKSLFIGCELGHALYDLLQPLDCVIIGAAACSALRALIRGIIFWRWSGVAGIQLLAPCRCCYSLGRPRIAQFIVRQDYAARFCGGNRGGFPCGPLGTRQFDKAMRGQLAQSKPAHCRTHLVSPVSLPNV